jgi:hypothetical protein
MSIETILSQIDSEIASLEQAKALLSGYASTKRGSEKPHSAAKTVIGKPKRKRRLTPEGRARIAAAVRARWAAQKKAAKAAANKAPKRAGRTEAARVSTDGNP